MHEETRAEKSRRLLPVVIACVLLIGVAAWASVLLPEPPDSKTPSEETTTQKRLGEWGGQLALFEGGADKPVEVYEVMVATLPEEEQQRLREGIVIEDEEMLALLLDNYTS